MIKRQRLLSDRGEPKVGHVILPHRAKIGKPLTESGVARRLKATKAVVEEGGPEAWQAWGEATGVRSVEQWQAFWVQELRPRAAVEEFDGENI